MNRRWIRPAAPALGALALACWVVMFLSGTDVWHAAGRPLFWNLSGAPYPDLRAFASAFYVLCAVLTLNLIVTALDFATSRR
jgi:hypothetical protein